MDTIYLCYLCKKQADKNGYIQLNIYGLFECNYCSKTYPYQNLLKIKDTTGYLTFSYHTR
jgi:DNA-directed RNA polymerase subunit RPC12/RpoP